MAEDNHLEISNQEYNSQYSLTDTNFPEDHFFMPVDLVGNTFLLIPREDGKRLTARIERVIYEGMDACVRSIVRLIKEKDTDPANNPIGEKYLCYILEDP